MRLSVCWGRAACCARGRRATWLMVLLVVLLVFGCRLVCLARPGCLVCPWPAARPRAVRAASFARRVASKPSQAPPPPTGTAARPSGPSGTLHTGGACVAVTSPARPYRMGTAAHAAAMLAGLAVSSMPAGLGLAHCATVSKWAAMGLCGMRSWLTECRRRVGVLSSASPLRVAVRSRFAVVSCPKCRPPRRKTLKTGCYGRSGLRFGRIGTCHSTLLAREPAIASGNPLCRTSTRYLERGRGCPRSY